MPKPKKPPKIIASIEEFADVERYHTLPGIFQMSQGGRPPQPVDISLELRDGGSVRIVTVQALTPFDARMLCAILRGAAMDKKILDPSAPVGEVEKILVKDLELKEDARDYSCLLYKTSGRDLCERMGLSWAGKEFIERINSSIERLSMIHFVVTRYNSAAGKRRMEKLFFSVMSGARVIVEDGDKAYYTFAINPLLAESLLVPRHFVRIDTDRLKDLSDIEALLFLGLSAAIDPGKSRMISTDLLRDMIYGKPPAPKPGKREAEEAEEIARNTGKQKRKAYAAALELVKKIPGWTCEEREDGLLIQRPVIRKPRLRKTQKAIGSSRETS